MLCRNSEWKRLHSPPNTVALQEAKSSLKRARVRTSFTAESLIIFGTQCLTPTIGLTTQRNHWFNDRPSARTILAVSSVGLSIPIRPSSFFLMRGFACNNLKRKLLPFPLSLLELRLLRPRVHTWTPIQSRTASIMETERLNLRVAGQTNRRWMPPVYA